MFKKGKKKANNEVNLNFSGFRNNYDVLPDWKFERV